MDPYCYKCKRKHWHEWIAKPENHKKRKKKQDIYRNTPEAKAERAEKQRIRRREDSRFQLDEAMSGAIRTSLRGRKNGQRWESLVHYTLDELAQCLEKQFQPGMNWTNHGNKQNQWSIDHIIPKSRFNYEKPEDIDFQRCWALKNLQPLWHFGPGGNMSKNDNIERPFQPCLKLEVT